MFDAPSASNDLQKILKLHTCLTYNMSPSTHANVLINGMFSFLLWIAL